MTTHWIMSFVNPDRPEGSQWLGTACVEAQTMVEALRRSHRLGINPGGEAQTVAFETKQMFPEYLDRLITDKHEVLDMPFPEDARGIENPDSGFPCDPDFD